MKTILVDAVRCFVVEKSGSFVIFKEMHDLLETYQNKKILLTGANNEESNRFGLYKMPYTVFTLKHDPEKSNSEYFKIMLKKFGLEVKDVIYFEHSQKAVDSAKFIGIETYFYDENVADLNALKEFLDKNL